MAPARILISAVSALLVATAARGADGASPNAIPRLPLTTDGSVYLTLGGELRERYEYYSEPFFGLRSVAEDDYLLHRLLLSADPIRCVNWFGTPLLKR